MQEMNKNKVKNNFSIILNFLNFFKEVLAENSALKKALESISTQLSKQDASAQLHELTYSY